jgi:hypothetical protein
MKIRSSDFVAESRNKRRKIILIFFGLLLLIVGGFYMYVNARANSQEQESNAPLVVVPAPVPADLVVETGKKDVVFAKIYLKAGFQSDVTFNQVTLIASSYLASDMKNFEVYNDGTGAFLGKIDKLLLNDEEERDPDHIFWKEQIRLHAPQVIPKSATLVLRLVADAPKVKTGEIRLGLKRVAMVSKKDKSEDKDKTILWKGLAYGNPAKVTSKQK